MQLSFFMFSILSSLTCKHKKWLRKMKVWARKCRMLCSLEECCVLWKNVVFSGRLLCSLEECCVLWKIVVFSGRLLCSQEECCVLWKIVVFSGRMLCSLEDLTTEKDLECYWLVCATVHTFSNNISHYRTSSSLT